MEETAKTEGEQPAPVKAFPRLAPCGTSLAWLARAYHEQLHLCEILEAIADSLPDRIDPDTCLMAARSLLPLLRGVHRYEETILYPWLEQHRSDLNMLPETLSRLKFEHWEDACFAEELTDALITLGHGNAVNEEAVGYMLRGFFEGLRRHIAFEREHILSGIHPGVDR